MISLIGALAESIGGALPPDLEVVAFDVSAAGTAFIECARRRELGLRFYTLPLADDLRVATYSRVAATLNAQVTDADMRYAYARELAAGVLVVNGAPAGDLVATDARPWEMVYETVLLSDELLVRSHGEYAEHYARALPGHRMRRILLTPSIPAFEADHKAGTSVVIWCGRRSTAAAALALIGSEELRTSSIVYVGDTPLPNVSASYLAPNDPDLAGVLARAGCIVCVDPSDPADAVAFAQRGKCVVAPIMSGALEFEPDVITWDATNAQKLYRSVALALGRVPSGAPAGTVPSSPLVPAYPLPADELPLVSILTPTYNRPEMLRKMLTSIAAQTYPNIESVVVNDAGSPVEHIVAEFPFARLFNAETNGGTLSAMERALHESRGTYIGLLPDDDWLYPDHVQRLMTAILKTNSPVAHGNALLRFLGSDERGNAVTTGFNARSYSETVNPISALVGTPVAHHQVLQRRDTYDPADLGWFLKDTIVADQEYHMRLTDKYQLVWVDSFTCEFRDHPDNAGKKHDWATSNEYIYNHVQPRPDRPFVEAIRKLALETMRQTPMGENANKPTLIIKQGA